MTELENSGHERWQDDAAAYALHALDGAEVRAFEDHLADCPECRQELATMRRTVGELAGAAAVVDPPAQLRRRVMATVRAEAATRAGPHGAPAPGRGQSRWQRPRIALSAAAVAVVLVVLAVALTGGGGRSRTYAGVVSASGATASLVRSGASGQLRFRGLPAPPAGRIYQVWLAHGSQAPRPTHTLFASTSGSTSVGGSLSGVTAVLVTAEPLPDGSRAPTRAPIIIVRLG